MGLYIPVLGKGETMLPSSEEMGPAVRDIAPPSVIPVLVTGIQCAVSTARETLLLGNDVFHNADALWLDSRHKAEEDGGKDSATSRTTPGT